MCACPLHSTRALTNGSGGSASLRKIVGNVQVPPVGSAAKRRGLNAEAACLAASARELAFRLLYIRRPGAGIRRLLTSVLKVGGLFEKARSDIRIRACHRKLQQCRRLIRQIFLTRHNLVPRYYSLTTAAPAADYARRSNPFLEKSTKVNFRAASFSQHGDQDDVHQAATQYGTPDDRGRKNPCFGALPKLRQL